MAAHSASPAISRAAEILATMAERPQRTFGPSELSRKTGIPKSSVLNICTTMSTVGFLRRDDHGFRLHYRLAELGNAYLRSLSEIEEFYDLCRRKLRAVPQTIQLGVLAGGLNVVFLARHDGREPLNLGRATEIGRSVPAHCTANGKALLAALDPDALKKLLPRNGKLPALTANSVGTSRALGDELNAIRRSGFSREKNEIVHGLNCFGIAILTPHREDRLLGMSFSYPEDGTTKSATILGSELRSFATQFAERIGGKLAF
jgi:DNA-binding IclR family transcriptional regulator